MPALKKREMFSLSFSFFFIPLFGGEIYFKVRTIYLFIFEWESILFLSPISKSFRFFSFSFAIIKIERNINIFANLCERGYPHRQSLTRAISTFFFFSLEFFLKIFLYLYNYFEYPCRSRMATQIICKETSMIFRNKILAN